MTIWAFDAIDTSFVWSTKKTCLSLLSLFKLHKLNKNDFKFAKKIKGINVVGKLTHVNTQNQYLAWKLEHDYI